MKIYISGKITGDRRYKAKFREVEKQLAAAGHIVLYPATAPEGLRPGDYMRLCFAMMEAADVVLMNDKPSKIATAIAISRRTLRIVHENIVFSLAVKLVILVLSALGVTGMWWAVVGDVGVLVLAVLNAMRALRFKE